MVEDQPPPENGSTSFVRRTERGELSMWLAAPTVLVFKYRGYSDATYLPFIEGVYERTLATKQGPRAIFVDCEEQTGYDSAFRAGIADWSRRIALPQTYCLFVKSRFVAMGIAIVRLAVGLPGEHAEVVTQRVAFRTKLEAAVQKSRALQASA